MADAKQNQVIRVYLWDLGVKARDSDERIVRYAQDYTKEYPGAYAGNDAKIDAAMLRIAREGKPYFPHLPNLHFSLSHSGVYGACALASQQVGLDLQMHSNRDLMKIARRFFHQDEYQFLEGDASTSFFQVWAAKESYVKYTGEGLARGFGSFCVVDKDGLLPAMGEVGFYHCEPWKGYSMCLCAKDVSAVEIVRI
ncbi:MAG: 4'-phosphopantetheinyl transferase superfamily protein [Clostridiales bacterium]|nr:4'-phosphopantetheinyl transferase superfamily protein [Clostridiales bacterium]